MSKRDLYRLIDKLIYSTDGKAGVSGDGARNLADYLLWLEERLDAADRTIVDLERQFQAFRDSQK